MGALTLPAKVGLWTRCLRYLRDPEVALWRRLSGLGAVLYVASPFDLIPDWIPVLGWLDDMGVVALVAWFMVREIHRHSAKAQAGPLPSSP